MPGRQSPGFKSEKVSGLWWIKWGSKACIYYRTELCRQWNGQCKGPQAGACLLFGEGETKSSDLDMLQFEKLIKHPSDIWRTVGYSSPDFRVKPRNRLNLFIVSIRGTRWDTGNWEKEVEGLRRGIEEQVAWAADTKKKQLAKEKEAHREDCMQEGVTRYF